MSLAYAKQLAKTAGLKIKTNEPSKSTIEEMEDWFSNRISGLLKEYEWDNDVCIAIDKEREAQYSERRSKRFKEIMETKYYMRSFGRVTRHFCGKELHIWRHEPSEAGFYTWKHEGKLNKSWMGMRGMALKTPKQIGGFLSAKYPGHDVTIIPRGYMESDMFINKAIMEPMIVPFYQVLISPKLPGWYLTAERLLLEGRLLDRDAAKELWDQYQASELTQQEYSERLANLCKQAEQFDDVPSGWVDLDLAGNFIEREPEDRPSMKTDDSWKDHEEALKLYDDEDEEFDDLEEERQIGMMLGMTSEGIELAELTADRTEEFIKQGWSVKKPKQTTKGEGDLSW